MVVPRASDPVLPPGEGRQHGSNEQQPRSELDEAEFIRARLFENDKSSFSRYTDLAFRTFSWPKLIRYELLTLFIGSMPGAPGLLLRKWLYPALFRQTGKGVIFGANLTLRHADRITLGDGVMLDRDSVLDARGGGETGVLIGNRVIVNRGAAIQAKFGYIEIGADCNIGSHVDIVAQGSIVIEDNVSIAGKAMIAGGRYVVEMGSDSPETMNRFTSGPIRIGRNARIGMGAIVQDGVTVGENSIVAPGAVVYENVPADTVVWGNPARLVRDRPKATVVKADRTSSAAPHRRAARARLQQQICEYLEGDLFIEFGPGEFSVTDSLVDAGVLDSLALVRLSLWLEDRFQTGIDIADIDPSKLDTVEKIASTIDHRTRP